MTAFESMRRWIKSRPRLRRLLEPAWMAVLVGRQRALELALRLNNSGACAALRRWCSHLDGQRPVRISIAAAGLKIIAASLAGCSAWVTDATVRRRSAVLNAFQAFRRRIVTYGIHNERRAIVWAYGPRGLSRLPKRVAGRVALRVANIYYRRAFQRFGRFAQEPLLQRDAFDPNHVMLIVGSLGPGGAERQVVATLLGLRQKTDLRLTLVCIFLDQEWQRFFLPQVEQAGIEVVQMGLDLSAPLDLDVSMRERFEEVFSHAPPNLADIRQYAAEILRRRPGVLHTWMDETSCKGGLAALAVGVPRVVMSTRSVAPYHFAFYHQYLFEAYRTILRRDGTVLLNNSHAGARDYASWLGVDVRRVGVIHNGFHFEDLPRRAARAELRVRFRSQLEWPVDVPVLGTIMRFSEEKRPDLWVDAALWLARLHPDLRFLLVGDGPLRGGLVARVSREGRADRFAFTGYRRDTVAALCAMDAFLLTSRQEGLPNVLIEAQALGVPVIAPNVGGAAEAFVPGETGILLDRMDPRSIGHAVLGLLCDPSMLARFSQRAQDHVCSRFGIGDVITATLAAYGKATDFEQ